MIITSESDTAFSKLSLGLRLLKIEKPITVIGCYACRLSEPFFEYYFYYFVIFIKTLFIIAL